MIDEYEIKRCITSIDERVIEGKLKDTWDCISYCRGWFTKDSVIPISVIEYIAELYFNGTIK